MKIKVRRCRWRQPSLTRRIRRGGWAGGWRGESKRAFFFQRATKRARRRPGMLTLSGTASLSDYQTALRSITYSSLVEQPRAGTRTIRFSVSDGELESAISSRTIEIEATIASPVVVVVPPPVTPPDTGWKDL